MTGVNWPLLMRVAFQRLGLKPWEFWALTPAELIVLLGPSTAEAPLTRSRLKELTEKFPDIDKEADDEWS